MQNILKNNSLQLKIFLSSEFLIPNASVYKLFHLGKREKYWLENSVQEQQQQQKKLPRIFFLLSKFLTDEKKFCLSQIIRMAYLALGIFMFSF